MSKDKRGKFYLVGWILLLIAVFVSFLVVLEYQKKNNSIVNEESLNVKTATDFNNTIETTKLITLKGLKTYLVIGGIFSIAGIVYLFYWIFSVAGITTKRNFEDDFRINN